MSTSISACVGDGLLPDTTDIAVTARELQVRMQKKLKKIEVLRFSGGYSCLCPFSIYAGVCIPLMLVDAGAIIRFTKLCDKHGTYTNVLSPSL